MPFWVVYMSFAIVGAASFHIALKYAGGALSSAAGILVLQIAAAIGAFLIYMFSPVQPKEQFTSSVNGIALTVFAGIVIMLTNYCIIAMYAMNAPISIAVPVIRSGAMLLSFIAGVFLFQEGIDFKKIMGLGLTVSGLFLLLKK